MPGEAGLVVATPGAEPVADGGYGAVLLLDTWALLTRADLRAGEEALRRWLAAAALARPAPAGGRVVVVADGALAAVQALLRWDPAWFAARELAERRELGFPPAVRMASVTGAADGGRPSCWRWPGCPTAPRCSARCRPATSQERMLVRVPRPGRARSWPPRCATPPRCAPPARPPTRSVSRWTRSRCSERHGKW